jgi:hypothetical protein
VVHVQSIPAAIGRGRDVFGAFEVAHDQRARFGARGREGETAMAHDGSRRAVPRGTVPRWSQKICASICV